MKSKSLRGYLLAGLVVWLPIIVTLVILRFLIDLLDHTMELLPHSYQPEQLFGIHIPGLGVLLSVVVLILTGLAAANFFGQRIVIWSESMLTRIPLVNPIYNAAKQIIHAVFSTNGQSFRKVLLVEYPRKDMWSLAFLTATTTSQEVSQHTGKEMISVFIPTTPNPTSGFLLMVPKEDAIELSMTVDEALKFTISLGMMQPVSSAELEEEKERLSL